MERVVPGVEFDFELVYRMLDMQDGAATDKAINRSRKYIAFCGIGVILHV